MTRRSVVLSWKAPDRDGGSPITNYIIEMRQPGQFRWQPAIDERITSTEAKITGLSEGHEYEFRVAAENRAGKGAFAECESAVKVQEPIGE
jgi:titin